MTALADILRRRIAQGGPMPVAEWMALCLGHPEHGYYMRRDPLGRAGDFTTAPEISQMFGELIGLWLAAERARLDGPAVLAELGPGRGTLMADALRAAEAASPGFRESVDLVLVETSPALAAEQDRRLPGARRVARTEDLPDDRPLLAVANEFLDALPIRQMVRAGGRWRERVVGLHEDRLIFGLGRVIPWDAEAPDGAVREVSAPAEAVAAALGARLAAHGGAALLIDYGAEPPDAGGGDTLQALQGHAPVDPLEAPGEADLTAHVDFLAVARAAAEAGAAAWPLATQGAFLERLGVTDRARALARAATERGREDAAEDVVAAHRRLTHPDAMGTLFKVLVLTGPDRDAIPAGLDPDAAPRRGPLAFPRPGDRP